MLSSFVHCTPPHSRESMGISCMESRAYRFILSMAPEALDAAAALDATSRETKAEADGEIY